MSYRKREIMERTQKALQDSLQTLLSLISDGMVVAYRSFGLANFKLWDTRTLGVELISAL